MKTYEFSENNSGGSWWLNREDYDALMADGWRYELPDGLKDHDPIIPFEEPWGEEDDTVPYGWRHYLVREAESLKEAVESFERATGRDFFSEGCNCCGAPFSISSRGEGDWEYMSGDSVSRQVIRPW